MKIAVGTKNPVKIQAVSNAFKRYWSDFEVVSINADSQVSDMPGSEEEAIAGAINRAKQALEETQANYGVGLEGYFVDSHYGMFLSGWVAIVDQQGKIGLGNAGKNLLPDAIATEMRHGKELGPVMDEFIGVHDIKKKQGTVGILTKNQITRTAGFENGVVFALVRFVNPQYYD